MNLFRNEVYVTSGGGADVLGSPLKALRHLNDLMADHAFGSPLAAGEEISTVTLTPEMTHPWGRAELAGIALSSIAVGLM